MTDTPNETADDWWTAAKNAEDIRNRERLATQCPKCCGTGTIIYLGAPSIVCIDCGGSGRVQTRSVTNAH